MVKLEIVLVACVLLLLPVRGQVEHCSWRSLVSAGIDTGNIFRTSELLLEQASESCELPYGFLPCTTSILGNLFLVLVYGYLMFLAAKFLAMGSDDLLVILGPGIVGGLFLPILRGIPEATLVLASGLSESKETAQHQVSVGVGLLAGSTIMLLTLLWGSCVLLGKRDHLVNSTSVCSQKTMRIFLQGSGVATDLQTSHSAKIMTLSVVPLIILQLPKIFHTPSGDRVAVLVSVIVALIFLLSYCVYQVAQPSIQRRRLAYVKHKHIMSGILRHVHEAAVGRLLTATGEPNIPVLKKLFERLDLDYDGVVSIKELMALIVGIEFEQMDLDKEEVVEKVMEDFDKSKDEKIDMREFIHGITRWLEEAKRSNILKDSYSRKFLEDFYKKTWEEYYGILDTVVEVTENISLETIKAVLHVLAGTVLAIFFADPLVDSLTSFSNATNIPLFIISFIAAPLATNFSEAASAIISARKKQQKITSLALSEIYGGVTMNNTLSMAVFLALVYIHHLTGDFSAEVLAILIVCIIMGVLTSFRTTFPLWTCVVAYLMYPLSLVLVYVIKYVFGG